jgi:hypothetical protein
MSPSAGVTAPLVTHLQHVAFAALVLHRMGGLVQWIRQQPVPAGNIVDEALGLGFGMTVGAPFDVQRVYELVGLDTGTSGVMAWKDAEAQIIGRTVDHLLRAIARPDHAPFCAARVADLMLALHELDFADPDAAVELEKDHLARLAHAIASEHGPIGPALLNRVPEYPRGELAPHAAAKMGKPWFEAFGPSAAAFPGPEWEDPFDDSVLRDGRDPQTTRMRHVAGW